MWKKGFCLGALALLLCAFFSVSAAGIGANAKGAVLIEAQSGRVLFAQNERERLPMASTTKIMTALLALEQENLDEYFTVDSAAIHVEGSSMGLAEGDSVTLRVLAAGMLLASGNDAANAAAVRIAGDIPAFVAQMNDRAAELGMKDTSFETPSGLDGDAHYSTAYDMALLARAALQNSAFAEICKQPRMTLEFGNPPFKRWLKNHNAMLGGYDGAIGVKTGFTKRAGRCLVSAAERGGVKLICVTLSCPDDWRDHAGLLDYGFSQLESVDFLGLLPPLTQPVGGGVKANVRLVAPGGASLALAQGEESRVKVQILLERFAFAPLRAGDLAGEAVFTLDGAELLRVPLCIAEDIAARPVTEKAKSLPERIRQFFEDKRKAQGAGGTAPKDG